MPCKINAHLCKNTAVASRPTLTLGGVRGVRARSFTYGMGVYFAHTGTPKHVHVVHGCARHARTCVQETCACGRWVCTHACTRVYVRTEPACLCMPMRSCAATYARVCSTVHALSTCFPRDANSSRTLRVMALRLPPEGGGNCGALQNLKRCLLFWLSDPTTEYITHASTIPPPINPGSDRGPISPQLVHN